ncbi:MAG: DUF2264 domain-containing protein [Acidobacteria bacterium]|nr:DUF2264 domain-containing protein [Acidobacteriota bacterium]
MIVHAGLAGLDPGRRDHAQRACALLLDAVLGRHREGAARIRFGRRDGWQGAVAGEVEAVLRPLWGLFPLLGGGGGHPLSRRLSGILEAGCDPSHPDHWGQPGDLDQRLVEAAVLGLGLRLCPDVCWEPLAPAARERLGAWLGAINHRDIPDNNWVYFRALVNVGLRAVGSPNSSPRALRESLERADSFHLGEGWYGDGPTGRVDWYGPWAFHFYGPLLAWLARGDPQAEPLERSLMERSAERARQWLPEHLAWFAQDGAALAFGRSLGYRFAQAAGLGALALCDPPGVDWGVLAGAWRRNLSWWFQRPIFQEDGSLSLGYGYSNDALGEPYQSQGSPYWALKAFLPLLLPPSHPFWQAPSSPLPPLDLHRQDVWPARLWRGPDGQVQALCATRELGGWAGPWVSTYGKFAYATGFPASLQTDLDRPVADGTLLIALPGGALRPPLKREAPRLRSDGLSQAWSPFPGVRVDTLLLARPPWHLRIHRLECGMTVETLEGGFAVEAPGARQDAGPGWAWAAAGPRTSLIVGEASREGRVQRQPPGSNLLHPESLAPVLAGAFPPGAHRLCAAVWCDARGSKVPDPEPPRWGRDGTLEFLGERLSLD